MSKKRVYTVIGIVLVLSCFMIPFMSNKSSSQLEHVVFDGKTDSYDNLEELEAASPIIVYGKKVTEAEPQFIYDNNNQLVMLYTLSDFEISKIYKNDSELKIGDKIPIIENEATDKRTGKVYHIANYSKMNTGNEYVLFLHYSDHDGWYVPTAVDYGKVPADPSEELIYEEGLRARSITSDKFEDVISEARDKYLE
ncbi:hypothetical protein UT300018_24770 [Clostridium faecium]